jgi:hypothetical protein
MAKEFKYKFKIKSKNKLAFANYLNIFRKLNIIIKDAETLIEYGILEAFKGTHFIRIRKYNGDVYLFYSHKVTIFTNDDDIIKTLNNGDKIIKIKDDGTAEIVGFVEEVLFSVPEIFE